MKRVLALILAAVTVVLSFSSCSTLAKDDKGAIITMFLTDQILDFDPARTYTNDTCAQLTTLIYEGLTTLDGSGNWKKGMMKSYKVVENKDGSEKLQITLRDSKWSDGRTVQANDFVYAWKRIVEPTNKCEAACLLYDIKNARSIKMGDATVDDLGVYAVETYVLEIEFEHEVDIDEFLRTCASPALVPLREDKIGTSSEWAKKASTMVTNGPFAVRKIEYGTELRLERSAYYYRDTEKNQALDKYVIPYRIVVKYAYGNEEKQLERFNNGEVYYIGDIALASRGEYTKQAEINDNLATHTYYFNTENELFEDARVRQALSMAIDRNAIAEKLVFAKAATGFVPEGIADASVKKDFRENADKEKALINTSADIEGAKALLKQAGVTRGSFTLTVRDDETDVAVAEMVKAAWEQLGFKVKIDALGAKKSDKAQGANEAVVYNDMLDVAFAEGDFDVIAIDYQMIANNAFSALAPFAVKYSGNGVDMKSETYDPICHITGYSSKEYDEIIDKAYEAADSKEESELLHQAEAKLLEDMPVMPVVFLQNAYITNSKVISGVKTGFWGNSDLKRVKMKNYMKYKEALEAEAQAGA